MDRGSVCTHASAAAAGRWLVLVLAVRGPALLACPACPAACLIVEVRIGGGRTAIKCANM